MNRTQEIIAEFRDNLAELSYKTYPDLKNQDGVAELIELVFQLTDYGKLCEHEYCLQAFFADSALTCESVMYPDKVKLHYEVLELFHSAVETMIGTHVAYEAEQFLAENF